MSQFKNKGNFYYTLAMLLDSGVSMQNALHQRFSGIDSLIKRLSQQIEAGETLYEACSKERFFSHFELTMIMVGEYSGKLPAILRSLSDWFNTRHNLQKKIYSSLLYPLFIYHVAGIAFTIVNIFKNTQCVSLSIFQLCLWFAIPWLAFAIYKVLHSILINSLLLGNIANVLPIFGDLLFKINTAFFFKVLSMALSSGVGAQQAISMAADCCPSKLYKKHYQCVAEAIKKHACTFTQAFNHFATSREINSPILTMLANAELSGQLPETCEKIAAMQLDGATSKMELLAKAIPGALYMLILIYLGFKIISFYAGYVKQIEQLL